MNYPTVEIDFAAISAAEEASRRRLREEPCDSEARISLAWCLFVRALHQAGQESVLARLPELCAVEDGQLPCPSGPAPSEREAAALLLECLEETHRIRQLGLSAEDWQEAASLQAAARLVAGDAPVAQSAAAAEERVLRLVRAVLTPEASGID